MNSGSTELFHYGVKGMKWGVRRAEKRAARNAKKEQKRKVKEATKYVKKMRRDWVDIHNSAADVDTRNLKSLNKKYEGVDFKKNKKAYRRYVDEYVSMWNGELVSEVTKRYGDRPERLSEEDILANLPTRITDSGAQHLYDSMYE